MFCKRDTECDLSQAERMNERKDTTVLAVLVSVIENSDACVLFSCSHFFFICLPMKKCAFITRSPILLINQLLIDVKNMYKAYAALSDRIRDNEGHGQVC